MLSRALLAGARSRLYLVSCDHPPLAGVRVSGGQADPLSDLHSVSQEVLRLREWLADAVIK